MICDELPAPVKPAVYGDCVVMLAVEVKGDTQEKSVSDTRGGHRTRGVRAGALGQSNYLCRRIEGLLNVRQLSCGNEYW